MCLPVSGYTTTHCRCICTSLDPSVSLCFSEDFYYCSAIKCLTDCTCICESLDQPFSLTLSAYGYIIDNLHGYEQARSAHSACNCTIYLSLHFAWIRTSLNSSFSLPLCLWMCVAVSGILFLIVGLLIRVSHSLFLWMFLFFFGYIVTNCTSIGTFLDPRTSRSFFLFVSVFGYIIGNLHVCEQVQLTQCVIALWNLFICFILRAYVHHLSCISFSLFVSECV